MNASEIAKKLGDAEPETRRLATMAIAQLRGRDAASLLVRALADGDWRVRKEAAQVAASVEPRPQIIDALVHALHDAENVGLRNGAVEALIGIGQEGIPKVVAEMAALDADGRKLAVEVLGGVPDPRGARALCERLTDLDVNVRAAAAEALGRAGASGDEAREDAVAALTAALSNSEMFVVAASLDALVTLDAKLPWARLAPLVKDTMLRRHALAAAALAREPEALAAVGAAIGDRSPTIAKIAVQLVYDKLVWLDPDAVVLLRDAMTGSAECAARLRALAKSEEPALRGAALAALGLLRDEADVPLLVEALADDTAAQGAELGLRLFGSKVVAPVIAAGKAADPAVRGASISMVPILAHGPARELVSPVREALESAQTDVVQGALRALSLTGGADDLPSVAALARHSDRRVASMALSTLFAIAGRERDAANALRQRIDPAGADAAAGCVLIDAAARRGGKADERDLAFLKTALSLGGVTARRAALEALATLGGDAAAETVSFALADEEQEVVLVAVRAMGRLGRTEALEGLAGSSSDAALVAAVLRALGDADPDRFLLTALPLVKSEQAAIAGAAVEAFGRMEGRVREDGLFAALDHPDAEVVKLALTEVGRAPDARALARLGMCLDHRDADVRRLAGELLGNAGGPGAQALLRARLARERDSGVRASLTAALMTPPREPVEPVE